jgi:hypothetical protein
MSLLQRPFGPWFLAAVFSLALAAHAEAQSSLGVRANGMGGAFVGVADDGTAVYWNPAGLATGAFAAVNLEYGEFEPDGPGEPAKMSHSVVAISLPPVGMAYYRQGVFGERPLGTAVTGGRDREEVRSSVQAFQTSTFAISLLQSVTEYVVVAATPKFVWGGESFKVDVDASAMLALSHVRVGVTGRNLTTPSFAMVEDGPEDVEQATEVRVGGGWGSGWPGASAVVIAVDGDVLTRPTLSGDRRDIAGGVETWLFKRRFGVRGGMRTSTVGDARTAVTAGASAMFSGMYLEGYWAGGDAGERSWGLGLRYSF